MFVILYNTYIYYGFYIVCQSHWYVIIQLMNLFNYVMPAVDVFHTRGNIFDIFSNLPDFLTGQVDLSLHPLGVGQLYDASWVFCWLIPCLYFVIYSTPREHITSTCSQIIFSPNHNGIFI